MYVSFSTYIRWHILLTLLNYSLAFAVVDLPCCFCCCYAVVCCFSPDTLRDVVNRLCPFCCCSLAAALLLLPLSWLVASFTFCFRWSLSRFQPCTAGASCPASCYLCRNCFSAESGFSLLSLICLERNSLACFLPFSSPYAALVALYDRSVNLLPIFSFLWKSWFDGLRYSILSLLLENCCCLFQSPELVLVMSSPVDADVTAATNIVIPLCG